MCGIAGFYHFRDDELIKKISKQLNHRGPDGEGYYINENVTLLNRRLAIIDLKGGQQPVFNEDKTLVLVFNGEIYNFRQLRKELISSGHIFKSNSDTEVIVHGYEQWGEACFDKFNGMFALALYNKKTDQLILARDHFGIKPLYYARFGEKLIFASEIKPIFYSRLFPCQPNDKIIYRYLRFRVHDDGRETFFSNIYRLMPGELMVVSKNKFVFKKYTDLEQKLLEKKTSQSFDEKEKMVFKNKLEEAVRLRLISEVPVGTCLSGGLDSSAVAALINKLLMSKVPESASIGPFQNSFSAVFPGYSNDEEKYIDRLIFLLNSKIKSYKTTSNGEEFYQDLTTFIRLQEEPTISTGPYAQFKVMQLAKKYVTVLLDGQGADEMLAGYLPYFYVYLNQLWQNKKFYKFLKELWGVKDLLANFLWLKIHYFFGIKKNYSSDIFINEFFEKKYQKEKFLVETANLKVRLVKDIFYDSLPALLRYEDRNSMFFSLEGRLPFLDKNLLQYIFSFKEDFYIKNGWNKYALRQSLTDLLPSEIIERRNKIGFTTPEKDWFLRLKNKIYLIFTSEQFKKRKYFNHKKILDIFQEFLEGKFEDTMIFWRCLNLELWLREFFDKEKPEKKPINYRRSDFEPNAGKKLVKEIDNNKYYRFSLKTKLIKKGDNLEKIISKKCQDFFYELIKNKQFKDLRKKTWFLVISEKIVAVAQGRSYFIWEIKPTFLAKLLSNFVTKTPYGIGLGSPWTMQLAIEEVGWLKILAAAFLSFITKPFGIKGIFYQIAGKEVAAIDGPTEYSLYPSNVSAKLGPKNPDEVANKIKQSLMNNSSLPVTNFQGVAIIDANDLGQNILGNSTNINHLLIEKIFADNPMGQADEQTPIVIVFRD
ncbi:MAG: asparagine synthase (glutamine-hydrolyzing) [Microgenomates group bacterium]|nr:asparagine synthase (glutamine-hydrolyzing) [Microgenomates group bacterium]